MKNKHPTRRRTATGSAARIEIRGACQHNLRDVDVDIPAGSITTVTGPSGSGKTSLARDTLYAEGQRRYVETFSPYARQFLSRMSRPEVERITGIPPAIAIEQRTRIISSRSTVATLTELLDHVKVLYANLATLHCRSCGEVVAHDTVADVVAHARKLGKRADLIVAFPVRAVQNFEPREVTAALTAQSIRRLVVDRQVVGVDDGSVARAGDELLAVLDRIPRAGGDRTRVTDSVEQALRLSQGHVSLLALSPSGNQVRPRSTRHFCTGLSCPGCSIDYTPPTPGLFSFNSPLGACPTCRGFGKTIEIDPSLVIPDPSMTLAEPLVKPWAGKAYRRWTTMMRKYARSAAIPLDVPWADLPESAREQIWNGASRWRGIRGFFKKLEKKSYKMHVRVLLSRYRTYVTCTDCHGGKLRPEALLYTLAGYTVPALMSLPLERLLDLVRSLEVRDDPAASQLVDQMTSRLTTACEVGLGYLSLDRDSRTLSGGEVERLGLSTALGASLTRTLYVLDEPSTGLHPRDIDNLMAVIRRLRDRGNTLVIVEHDRRMIRGSDLVVDMGPGAGSTGGRVVASGSPVALMARKDSCTGRFLSGRDEVPVPRDRRTPDQRKMLRIEGARARNLADIDVSIPLGLFVAMTGVSGSGKTTLLTEIIHRGVTRLKGEVAPQPGPHDSITGHESLRSVLLIDQSPVSSTPRANPATYTGVFTAMRKLFSSTDLAVRRGYAPGTFSFNVRGGRCERCQGSGHEKVEMQFLSDLYLPCPECDGRRYRDDVLEVKVDGLSIADALELTVQDASELMARHLGCAPPALAPLGQVGLGYLTLGQPLSTLSGGEAQRVKLAGRLAARRERGGLVLLDEPTRGLHPSDVKNLIEVLESLVVGGDTVVVVEHDMDLIKCADWVIDLGPEGGDGGGRVVSAGSPEHVSGSSGSRTAPYLIEALGGKQTAATRAAEKAGHYRPTAQPKSIEISGANENNLAGVDARIPLGRLTVVTGPSGSGKSTIVFDVLHAEGQRRYLDSLSAYARQFVDQLGRPDVDSVTSIPPTVAIEQRTARGGPRSTVGTMSEILPYLRLLWARAGRQYCPSCDVPAGAGTRDAVVREVTSMLGRNLLSMLAPVVRSRKGTHREIARWASANGHARLRVDGRFVASKPIPKLDRYREHTIEIEIGRVKKGTPKLGGLIDEALAVGDGTLCVTNARGEKERFLSTLGVCPGCGRSFPELDPRMFSFNSPMGWCRACDGKGLDNRGEGPGICRSCNGARIRPLSRSVKLGGIDLPSLLTRGIAETGEVFDTLKLDARATEIARPLIAEILSRIAMLERVGLGYLGLGRRATSLSSGESQRVRLAAQLGSNLRGVCYILDEPTIGLHARDTENLVGVLRALRDRGNTVVVVEHDEQTIRAADLCIDLGPGGGTRGGRIVARGTPGQITDDDDSVTGRTFAHPPVHPIRGAWRDASEHELIVHGARVHNISGLDVHIPLGRLVAVTGVSGSGKSTLVRDVLVDALAADSSPQNCDSIEATPPVDRVLLVDQTPIGRTPRSTPATYIGMMTDLRKLFAALPESRARGYTASRFSFNSGPGRCPDCSGQGFIKIEMSFLPIMRVPCERCSERRYDDETLSVLFRGHSIADILQMNVSEALELLEAVPKLRKPLGILEQVGLGYLTLGQTSPTLSGGEAQRLKLASELVRPGGPGTLIVLEEPTTGLHTVDVMVLVEVLHRLVDDGASVIVVEHNLDVICEADHIIDMGPEGGNEGGRVVAEGTPLSVARRGGTDSHTARFLKQMLEQGRMTMNAGY